MRYKRFLIPFLLLICVSSLFACARIENNSVWLNFVTGIEQNIEPMPVAKGGNVQLPDHLIRKGYRFGGWYLDTYYTVPAKAEGYDENTILYAYWEKLLYCVEYHTGIDETVITETYAFGDPIHSLFFLREGYEFLGWFLDADQKVLFDFDSGVEKDLTLFAGWRRKFLTVTFWQSGTDEAFSLTVEYGKSIPPVTLKREGFVFAGWCMDIDGKQPFLNDLPVKEDLILYAKWTEAITFHDIVFYVGDAVYSYCPAEAGGFVTLPKPPEREGYNFEGWYLDIACTQPFSQLLPVRQDLSLHAKWTEKIFYNLTVADADGTLLLDERVEQGHIAAFRLPMEEVQEFDGYYLQNGKKVELSTWVFQGDLELVIRYRYQASPLDRFLFVPVADGYLIRGGAHIDFAGELWLPVSYKGKLIRGICGSDRPESGAFSFQPVTSVYIPSMYRSIGAYAFYENLELTQVRFGESAQLAEVGSYAFYRAERLASMPIPDGTERLGRYAFYGCYALTAIYLPQSMTGIGECAFALCIRLGSISVHPDNSVYCDKGGHLYSKDEQTLYRYAIGNAQKQFLIPERVRYIADYAFSNSYLDAIQFPRFSALTAIGDHAFSDCTKLIDFYLPDSVRSIGAFSFYHCASLERFHIGFDSKLQTIGDLAFQNCLKLTEIFLPEFAVLTGREGAATGLRNFWNCGMLRRIEVHPFHEQYAAYNGSLYNQDRSSLLTYAPGKAGDAILYSQTKTIEDSAFIGAAGVTSVQLPQSLERIESFAFYLCKGLQSISIPQRVTYIGAIAFSGCSGLTEVDFMEGSMIGEIGEMAFYLCGKLATFTITAQNPPFIQYDVSIFDPFTSAALTIYVPEASFFAYQAIWEKYAACLQIIA